jgi:hypothetical protein
VRVNIETITEIDTVCDSGRYSLVPKLAIHGRIPGDLQPTSQPYQFTTHATITSFNTLPQSQLI